MDGWMDRYLFANMFAGNHIATSAVFLWYLCKNNYSKKLNEKVKTKTKYCPYLVARSVDFWY
jgi:hypothetical protein